MGQNFYEILKVGRNASKEEIRSAFRALAKKFHPDLNQGNPSAEEKFKRIQEAYAVLSDEEKKRKYDLKLNYGSFSFRNERASRPKSGPGKKRSSPGRKKKTAPAHSIPLWFAGLILVLMIIMVVSQIMKKEERQESVEEFISRQDSTNSELSADNGYTSILTPYDYFFPAPEVDEFSLNKIVIINSEQTGAIVLVVNSANEKVIRHVFLEKGAIFGMENIPDGKYYFRILFGNNWDPDSLVSKPDRLKGFFHDNVFICRFPSHGVIEIVSDPEAKKFTNYRVSIDPRLAGDVNTLTRKEFFGLDRQK